MIKCMFFWPYLINFSDFIKMRKKIGILTWTICNNFCFILSPLRWRSYFLYIRWKLVLQRRLFGAWNILNSGLQTWNFENQQICLLFGCAYCLWSTPKLMALFMFSSHLKLGSNLLNRLMSSGTPITRLRVTLKPPQEHIQRF